LPIKTPTSLPVRPSGPARMPWCLRTFIIAAFGLGANRPQDAIYPMSTKDRDDNTYDGSGKYVMHFAKSDLPPVDGFWSLTMYDSAFFFVANPINRYSISARQDLKSNPDGSVDLLHPKRLAGRGQGIELATGSRRKIPTHAAHVLAKRKRPFDTRRLMENSRSDASKLGNLNDSIHS
jgi:Protein of unknown function (DUF1214)